MNYFKVYNWKHFLQELLESKEEKNEEDAKGEEGEKKEEEKKEEVVIIKVSFHIYLYIIITT